jgi:polysaccharide deacetylase family protein (PEP-CTERM system associated)
MNILTFDIEEWFVYQKYPKGGKDYYLPIIDDYLEKLLLLLKERKLSATFFCLGKVAEEYPYVIKKIVEGGHEIGCHSYEHKLVTGMTKSEFYEDTNKAKKILEEVSGQKVTAYRAPAFSITESTKWALSVLIELGFEYDCSIFPSDRSFGGFPSYPSDQPGFIEINGLKIKEFPVNISKILGMSIPFSGGGYFRLVPYKIINSELRKKEYVMSYFHIRDFDAKQKHVKSFRYFQSYYGIKSAYEKLSKYVRSNDFMSLYEASEMINWEQTQSIKLKLDSDI